MRTYGCNLMVLLGVVFANGSHTQPVFRGSVVMPTSKLSVTRLSKDGKRETISDEAEVRKVLCSRKVVSRLTHCPASAGVDVGSHAHHPITEQMYPGTKIFMDAIKNGQACPLPAPFMQIVDGHCCVGRDSNVWPNFCSTIGFIGTSSKLPKFEVNANIDIPGMTGTAAYEKLIPDNVFKIGSPDLPQMNFVWKPNTVQLSVYFSLSVAFLLLSAYVYSRLDEEATIAAGKKREQAAVVAEKATRSRRSSITSSSSESSMDQPVPRRELPPDEISSILAGPPPQPTMASSSSMAFGLLPPLPRARSASNSALPTPRP